MSVAEYYFPQPDEWDTEQRAELAKRLGVNEDELYLRRSASGAVLWVYDGVDLEIRVEWVEVVKARLAELIPETEPRKADR